MNYHILGSILITLLCSYLMSSWIISTYITVYKSSKFLYYKNRFIGFSVHCCFITAHPGGGIIPQMLCSGFLLYFSFEKGSFSVIKYWMRQPVVYRDWEAPWGYNGAYKEKKDLTGLVFWLRYYIKSTLKDTGAKQSVQNRRWEELLQRTMTRLGGYLLNWDIKKWQKTVSLNSWTFGKHNYKI